MKDHQAAKQISKNDGDESNASDFVEYSTEHLPIPQGLIQNYIKGKTAKKNSNQCKYFYFYFSKHYFLFIVFFSFYFSCKSDM